MATQYPDWACMAQPAIVPQQQQMLWPAYPQRRVAARVGQVAEAPEERGAQNPQAARRRMAPFCNPLSKRLWGISKTLADAKEASANHADAKEGWAKNAMCNFVIKASVDEELPEQQHISKGVRSCACQLNTGILPYIVPTVINKKKMIGMLHS